jgi:tetratricopeptide (TPR) repeat protein
MKRFLILFLSVLSLQIHAQTANDLYDAGMKFMDMTNYKQAILHFTQCVEKSPYYYDAYLYRGVCELKEGNEEKAMQDYNMAIEKKPDYYQAFFRRGLLHEQQGNTTLAINDFSSAIKFFPKYIAAYRQRAYAYVKIKEYDLALDDIKEAISFYDDDLANAPLYFQMAEIYELKEMKKEAFESYTKIIEILPDSAYAYYKRGLLLKSVERFAVAIEDFDKAIEKGYRNVEIHRKRTEACMLNKSYKEAIVSLDSLLDLYNTKEVQDYFNRGMCYKHLKEYEKAIESFNRAIAYDRKFTDAYMHRADAYVQLDKMPQARRDYTNAVQLEPKNGELYFLRAMMYYKMENYDNALADLDLAIQYEPTAEAYFIRGAVRYNLKDRVGACEDLDQAIGLGHEEAEEVYRDICR